MMATGLYKGQKKLTCWIAFIAYAANYSRDSQASKSLITPSLLSPHTSPYSTHFTPSPPSTLPLQWQQVHVQVDGDFIALHWVAILL